MPFACRPDTLPAPDLWLVPLSCSTKPRVLGGCWTLLELESVGHFQTVHLVFLEEGRDGFPFLPAQVRAADKL